MPDGKTWDPLMTQSVCLCSVVLPAVVDMGSESLHVSRGLRHALLLPKVLTMQPQYDLLCRLHHGFEHGHHRLQSYSLN